MNRAKQMKELSSLMKKRIRILDANLRAIIAAPITSWLQDPQFKATLKVFPNTEEVKSNI
jgi:hypothetical protein